MHPRTAGHPLQPLPNHSPGDGHPPTGTTARHADMARTLMLGKVILTHSNPPRTMCPPEHRTHISGRMGARHPHLLQVLLGNLGGQQLGQCRNLPAPCQDLQANRQPSPQGCGWPVRKPMALALLQQVPIRLPTWPVAQGTGGAGSPLGHDCSRPTLAGVSE